MDDIGRLNCPYCGEPFGSHVTMEFGSPRCRLVGGADGRQPDDERGEVDHGSRDEPLCPVCHLPASEHDPDYLCARYLPKGAIAHWRRDAPAVPDAALEPEASFAPSPLGFAESVRSAAAAEAMGLVVSEMERLTVALRESEAEVARLRAIGVASEPAPAASVDSMRLEVAEKAVRAHEAEAQGLVAALLESRAEVARLATRLRDRDAEIDRLKEELSSVRQPGEPPCVPPDRAGLIAVLLETNRDINRFVVELGDVKTENFELKESIVGSRRILDRLTAENSRLSAELADRDGRRAATRRDLDDVLATTGEHIAELRAEVIRLNGASPPPQDSGTAAGPVARHVVAVVVEDSDCGMVLLLRRSSACTWPGTWSFVSGHVEPGETPELACGRELAEETGLTAVRFEPAGTTETPARWPADAMLGHVFRAVGVTGRPANREPHRRDRMEWFSWDRLPSPLHPGAAQWIAEHGPKGGERDRH